MTNVALVGQYPAHTLEKFQELLKDLPVKVYAVDNQEDYAKLID